MIFHYLDTAVFAKPSMVTPMLRQRTAPIQMNERAAFFHAELMLVLTLSYLGTFR